MCCITISECGGALKDANPHIRAVQTSRFMELSSKQEVQLAETVPPTNITVSVSTSQNWVTQSQDSPSDEDWKPMPRNLTDDASKRQRLDSNNLLDEAQKCFPILPLARIKHPSDFTDTFLIQVFLS